MPRHRNVWRTSNRRARSRCAYSPRIRRCRAVNSSRRWFLPGVVASSEAFRRDVIRIRPGIRTGRICAATVKRVPPMTRSRRIIRRGTSRTRIRRMRSGRGRRVRSAATHPSAMRAASATTTVRTTPASAAVLRKRGKRGQRQRRRKHQRRKNVHSRKALRLANF